MSLWGAGAEHDSGGGRRGDCEDLPGRKRIAVVFVQGGSVKCSSSKTNAHGVRTITLTSQQTFFEDNEPLPMLVVLSPSCTLELPQKC